MRLTNILTSAVAMVALMIGGITSRALGQSQGNNAICLNPTTGATTCSNTSAKASWSGAYVDASTFASATTDLCSTLFSIINGASFVSGTVIDARGINSGNSKHDTTNSALVCAGTPWVQGTSSTTKSATILLPATVVENSRQWILPNQTHIIGEGSGGANSGTTTLRACNSATNCAGIFPSNTALLKMGTGCPATGCTGVSIDDLSLDGNAVTGVSGITNAAAEELSYVRHVNMFNLPGTGLLVTTGASNSGPYSGITFTTTGSASICASLQGATTNTRGIQGLTCTGPAASFPPNAIVVNAPNNTLQDIEVSGFTNGILIGNTAAVQGVVLQNIKGGSNVTNLVHISNTNAVTDLAIMGVVRNGATNAIDDQETLPAGHQLITDASVAVYVIGEKMGTAAAYSRFTTSPNANLVMWSVGTSALTAGATCPSTGSMYSNVGASSAPGATWYACTGLHWTDIQ